MRAAILLLALAACDGTVVEVVDATGAPVPDAEVFLNGVLVGTTDAAGRFTFPALLTPGDRLYSRLQVYEHPSYRPDHGPGAGWVYRAYTTSRAVEDSGSITDFVVTNAIGTQTLTLDPDQVLIGWHLVASLSWDATQAELDELVVRFDDASQYLFDVTDGQFVLEQVDIADDGQLWGSAEFLFDLDNTRRPYTSWPSGFLGPVAFGAPTIAMAPMESGAYASSSPETLVHELGHLAFGLRDEYDGPAASNCTSAQFGPDPVFAADGPKAACMMDAQTSTRKLCSGHADSAHTGGTWQLDPCWHVVADTYRDPAPPAGFARWHVITPDLRGEVVGTLPDLDPGLRPRPSPPLNRTRGTLCAPFTLTQSLTLVGVPVWVQPTSGPSFTLGRVKGDGSVRVSGVHMGDTIKTATTLVIVDPVRCFPP